MKRLLVAILALTLCACSSLVDARKDFTKLEGDVPSGLGRDLVVTLVDADAKLGEIFMAALEREFVSRDLFDSIARVRSGSATGGAAALTITVVSSEYDEVYDFYDFQGGYTVRHELDVELRDADDALVLKGHVSGIGVDDVTDGDYLIEAKREDVRLAAVHDAATKISHGLRRTVFDRQTQALKGLPEIGLPPGMAPLEISVLGFDDAPNARRLRGGLLTDLLTDTMIRLGSDFDVTPYQRAQRAVGREPPKSFFGVADYEVTLIGQHLTSRVFVVGQLQLSGGRVQAQAKLLTRKGKELGRAEADVEGLGALPVVAVQLAQALGERLQTVEIPEDGSRE